MCSSVFDKKKKRKKKSKISFLKYIHIGTDKFNKTKSSFDEGRTTKHEEGKVSQTHPTVRGQLSDQTSDKLFDRTE